MESRKKPETFTPVKPTLPPAPYLGGKKNLAKRICPLISKIPHDTFADVFFGMGGIFFRRDEKARAEVINDWNGEISNLFRVLQRLYPQFIHMLRFQLTSREEFERLVKMDPNHLLDLERAARFLYLLRTAFGGKVTVQAFGVSVSRPAKFDIVKLEGMLEDIHTRLSSVVIEHLPYAEFIRRYDRTETLFYLDPPYWGGETDYGKAMFSRDDFANFGRNLSKYRRLIHFVLK